MSIKEPSQELRAGRRNIESIPEYELLSDLVWVEFENEAFWVIKYRLKIDIDKNDYVLPETDWYMAIDDQYPFGDIDIFPAVENGLTGTFAHQSANYITNKNSWWTHGKLCVVPQDKILGNQSEGESYSAEGRLKWYIQRNISWIKDAAEGNLQKKGDYFELPDFSETSKYKFAYDEDNDSFKFWSKTHCKYGIADLVLLNKTLLLKRYFAGRGIQKAENFSGKYIEDAEKVNGIIRAVWVYIDKIPVIKPWQSPIIWKELKDVLLENGVDFYKLIGPLLQNIRDKNPKVLVIAFPIEEKIGESPMAIHWQAIELPEISSISKPPKGFRNKSSSLLLYDKYTHFKDNEQVMWMKSDNWSRSQISTRGQSLKKFNTKNILLIGAGALGSILAETLIRSGIETMTLIDRDPSVTCGNLVRHILTQEDIGEIKACRTALRLNKIFPNVKVIPQAVDVTALKKDFFNEYDIVIDCTANQEVLQFLATLNLEKNTLFISISLGKFLKRIFYFTCYSKYFDYEKYSQLLNPEIILDEKSNPEHKLVQEGLGCWHPAYPGTIDNIYLFVGAIVKDIEKNFDIFPNKPTLIIYFSKYDSNEFVGIEKKSIYEK